MICTNYILLQVLLDRIAVIIEMVASRRGVNLWGVITAKIRCTYDTPSTCVHPLPTCMCTPLYLCTPLPTCMCTPSLYLCTPSLLACVPPSTCVPPPPPIYLCTPPPTCVPPPLLVYPPPTWGTAKIQCTYDPHN